MGRSRPLTPTPLPEYGARGGKMPPLALIGEPGGLTGARLPDSRRSARWNFRILGRPEEILTGRPWQRRSGIMTAQGSDRDPLERLAEEFAQRYRRGERPSPAEYAAKYPE